MSGPVADEGELAEGKAHESEEEGEESVPGPEDERRSEDGERERAGADELFGCEFSLVITGGSVGSGVDGAHVDVAGDLSAFRSKEDLASQFDVDLFKGIFSGFGNDSDEVNDAFDPVHGGVEDGRVKGIALNDIDAGWGWAESGGDGVSGKDAGMIAAIEKGSDDGSSDKTISSGDKNHRRECALIEAEFNGWVHCLFWAETWGGLTWGEVSRNNAGFSRMGSAPMREGACRQMGLSFGGNGWWCGARIGWVMR